MLFNQTGHAAIWRFKINYFLYKYLNSKNEKKKKLAAIDFYNLFAINKFIRCGLWFLVRNQICHLLSLDSKSPKVTQETKKQF